MSDSVPAADGLPLARWRERQTTLAEAIVSGTLSVSYADGARVQYRTMAELLTAKAYADRAVAALDPAGAVDPLQRPVRAFVARPWNGFGR